MSHQAEPIDASPLLNYLDSLVNDVRDYVPRALVGFEEEAIHQARVGTRRLKAALDLMSPVLGKKQQKKLGAVLKELRRTLGPLRDLDVMIGRLEEVEADDPHATAAKWFHDQLVTRRQEEREEAADEPVGKILGKLGTWWGVHHEIVESQAAIPSLLAASIHCQLDEFAGDADRLSGVEERRADGDKPQDPHELRIAGKALRYTLEMADKLPPGLPAGVSKSFKAMQELLGQWHDAVVLSEQSMEVSLDAMLAHHDAALQAQICDLAKSASEQADERLKEFAELWRTNGAELANTIRGAFELTKEVSPKEENEPAESSSTSA